MRKILILLSMILMTSCVNKLNMKEVEICFIDTEKCYNGMIDMDGSAYNATYTLQMKDGKKIYHLSNFYVKRILSY